MTAATPTMSTRRASMCLKCEILGIKKDIEYVELSPEVVKNSTVEVFGLTAQTPPGLVLVLDYEIAGLPFFPRTYLGTLLYN